MASKGAQVSAVETFTLKGYVFTRVCHSVHREVSATPPGQTPSQTDTPKADNHPPPRQNPRPEVTLPGRHPPPGSACWDTHLPDQCMLGYGQQAGGRHPTGMHSCSVVCLQSYPNFINETNK